MHGTEQQWQAAGALHYRAQWLCASSGSHPRTANTQVDLTSAEKELTFAEVQQGPASLLVQ